MNSACWLYNGSNELSNFRRCCVVLCCIVCCIMLYFVVPCCIVSCCVVPRRSLRGACISSPSSSLLRVTYNQLLVSTPHDTTTGVQEEDARVQQHFPALVPLYLCPMTAHHHAMAAAALHLCIIAKRCLSGPHWRIHKMSFFPSSSLYFRSFSCGCIKGASI